jgi:hypothetical protein
MEENMRDAPLTKEYLEEVKRRCDLATPGPWISFIEGRDHTSGQSFIRRTIDDTEVDHDLYLYGAAVTAHDYDFIAHARQDIPLLLDEISRLNKMAGNCRETQGEKE